MFEVINFDSWNVYNGASEGSGRSEKIWLISDTGEIGLFKYPKIDPTTQKETTEHISEHLAHQLGEILKVPTAKVEKTKRWPRGLISCPANIRNTMLIRCRMKQAVNTIAWSIFSAPFHR